MPHCEREDLFEGGDILFDMESLKVFLSVHNVINLSVESCLYISC
jgi:hypothetical protein